MVDDRQMTCLERDQEIRQKESKADITTRNRVIFFGCTLLLLLLLAAVLLVVTAPPESQVVRAWVAGALIAAVTVLGAATLLRGRYGEKEGDVMMTTLPSFSRSGHRRRKRDDPLALPAPDQEHQ